MDGYRPYRMDMASLDQALGIQKKKDIFQKLFSEQFENVDYVIFDLEVFPIESKQ